MKYSLEHDIRNKLLTTFKTKFFAGIGELSSDIDSFSVGDNFFTDLSKAYYLWHSGNLDAGESIFSDLRGYECENHIRLKQLEIGLRSFYTREEVTNNVCELYSEVDPEIIFVEKELKETNYQVLLAMDNSYFKIFGKSVVNIFLSHSANALHIHVINPDADAINFMQRRAGKRLSCSYEKNMSSPTRHYSASVRYLILGTLLERYKRPILVLDADAVIMHDIDKKINKLLRMPKSVYSALMHNSWMPWNKYLAGNVLVKNDEVGVKFANLFREYYSFVVTDSASKELWFIDQNALYYAISHEEIKEYWSDTRIDGPLFIGPEGLSKTEFSSIVNTYSNAINFDGSIKLGKEDFINSLADCLAHHGISKLLINKFHGA